ncbi:MAG: hypothetical protein QOI24_1643 [Acidobacteriota bacterium]|jgi:uncharacterized RDD family membrane protein YckC|nr:hypothetical protein [Acidobacteriota bacterium]
MLCRNHVDVSEGVRRCARCQSPFCRDCLVTIQGRDYCAVCKNEQVMDVRSGTVSGVLPLASIGRRFVAQIVDSIITSLAVGIIAIPLVIMFAATGGKQMSDFAAYAVLAGVGVLIIGYISYEALMLRSRGATLGKMALKIRVVRPDGSPLSTGQAWGRAVSRAVMVHVLAILNYGAALVTKEKTCLHDILAKTRVVNAD